MRCCHPRVLLVTALALGCSPARDAPRNLDLVRVAKSSLLTNAPFLIGDQEGYFRREGIRLEYVDQPNTTAQALPGLEQGDVDVVAAAVNVGLINAIAGGALLRIVGDRGHIDPLGCQSFGIVGRQTLFGDGPVDARSLRGRGFSTNPVGQRGYLTALFLKRHGLRFSDVKVVRLPSTVERQALDAGSIDVVAQSDPFFFHLMQGGHRLLAGANELSPGTHLAVLVFGPSLLRRDRDLGLRFMKGYLRGVRQYSEGQTNRNVELISRGLGIDASDIRKMCWPATYADGHVNLQSLSDYQKWAIESGHFTRALAPSQLVDMEFAIKASQALDAEGRAR